MIYRVYKEYFRDDKHVGVFDNEAEALEAAETEAKETMGGVCALVVIEEPFGAWPKGRELHRIGGKL